MKTKSIHPNEDIQAIREIMERSSKFLSLSGLSGIFAGLCALAGAGFAWFFILKPAELTFDQIMQNPVDFSTFGTGFYLGLDALIVLLLAVLGSVFFSLRKAKKAGQQLWNNPTKRVLLHLMIPLVTGGIFTLILVFRNQPELVPAVMLIFYGLALVNAGKFTLGEVHYLGLTEIILGLFAGILFSQGLLFWVIGFGLVHIVYGTVMYYRHERSN